MSIKNNKINKNLLECDGGGACISTGVESGVSGPGFNTCNNTPGIGNAVVGGSDRWDNVGFPSTKQTKRKGYFKIRKKRKTKNKEV